MDYVSWELEQQRAALAALLLGAQSAGDGGEDGPQSPGEGEATGGGGLPGAQIPGPERAVSAWEGVRRAKLRGGEAGRSAETGAPAEAPTRGDRGPGEADSRSGGTGARRESQSLPGDRGTPETGEAPWAAGRVRPLSRERPAGRRREDGEAPQRAISAEAPEEGESAGGEAFENSLFAGSFAGGRAAGWNENPAAARRGPYGGGGGWAERSAQLPEISEGGGALPRRGAGVSPEDRAEESARALSRAVQRDARRYDGGFAIG